MTIRNSKPSYSSASLTPSAAYEGSTLTCTPEGASDPDGDTVTPTYTWYNGGSKVSGATSSTLTGASFNKNDSVYCRVTPSDGTDSGSTVSSNAVTIKNSTPVITSLTITAEDADQCRDSQDDPVFTANVKSSDVDSDAVTYTYVWYVDGKKQSATGSSIAVTSALDYVVEVFVTPTDGTASGTTGSDAYDWYKVCCGNVVCKQTPSPAHPFAPRPDGAGTAAGSGTTARDDLDSDGFIATRGDCDDDDATVYPGARDPFGDGIDQDCGGRDGEQPCAGLGERCASTLQDALDDAAPGDTVWVGPGTWLEHDLSFSGKAVRLEPSRDRSRHVVSGSRPRGRRGRRDCRARPATQSENPVFALNALTRPIPGCFRHHSTIPDPLPRTSTTVATERPASSDPPVRKSQVARLEDHRCQALRSDSAWACLFPVRPMPIRAIAFQKRYTLMDHYRFCKAVAWYTRAACIQNHNDPHVAASEKRDDLPLLQTLVRRGQGDLPP